MEWIPALLPWIVPPIIGAVIGYITNDIAIRMLFRPLTEKRIFGIRIPLTPGIIPKQRADLAESIGRMVSRELVNVETLSGRIESASFTSGLMNSVSSFSKKLLDMKLGDIRTDDGSVLPAMISRIASTAVSGFIKSDAFLDAVDEVAGIAVRALYRQPVARFLPDPDSQDSLLRKFFLVLSNETARDTILRGITAFIDSDENRTRPVRTFLSPRVMKDLENYLRSFYPKILEGVLQWLRGEKTHLELEVRGRFLLRDILDKLNAFQRLIVNAGQYDKRLSEKMPEIIDDIIRSIEHSGSKAENVRRITFSAGRFIRKWLAKTPCEIETELGVSLSRSVTALVSGIFDSLNDPVMLDTLVGKLKNFLVSHGETTVSELASGLFGLDENELTGRITRIVHVWRSSLPSEVSLPPDVIRFVSNFFQSRKDLTIRELVGLDGEKKDELDRFFTEQVQSLLRLKLPEVLESFDVRKLVVNKINSLDVESVEKLLLMVIAKHLKWINLFGAILGTVIGSVQVMLTRIL